MGQNFVCGVPRSLVNLTRMRWAISCAGMVRYVFPAVFDDVCLKNRIDIRGLRRKRASCAERRLIAELKIMFADRSG